MVVIIDPQNAGIAGNMVIGALLDLGADVQDAREIMEYYASYFGEIQVKINKIQKSGISATYVDVKCQDNDSIKYNELLERLGSIKHENVTSDILEFAKKYSISWQKQNPGFTEPVWIKYISMR